MIISEGVYLDAIGGKKRFLGSDTWQMTDDRAENKSFADISKGEKHLDP